MRARVPTAEETAFMESLKKAVADNGTLDILNITQVVAFFLGNLIALNDQRKFTPESLMSVVSVNITAGNQQVIRDLLGPTKGKA